MFIPLEIIRNKKIINDMGSYLTYMLFVDDVIDYTEDIKNKTLTYVNAFYGIHDNINYSLLYKKYLKLSEKVSSIPSLIIQSTKKEIEYGLKRKKIFEGDI